MFVSGVAVSDLVEEAAIDLVNNFEMARQKQREQLDGPLLQSLGKQGMIGVCEGAIGEIPGLVPPELRRARCASIPQLKSRDECR